MQAKLNGKWIRSLSMALKVMIIFVLGGCQKVINLNLVDSAPRLVVDGLITDSIGPYRIRLSLSGSYFNQPVLPHLSGAVVIISDNTGITDSLKEPFPGIYLTSKLRGIPGRTYSLKVLTDNKVYEGSSTMFSHVDIDSLKLERSPSQKFVFGGNGGKGKLAAIHCFFKDPTEKNFYRIKVYLNDTINVINYRLYNDQYNNGEETDIQVSRVKSGDVVRVELLSLDSSTYEYYHTLRHLLRSNPIFGSTPANPNTNLSNGALGYFGACAISSKTIVVTDSLLKELK